MTERRDTEKRDIFISYSRANTDFARDLYAKLQALGFTLWRDRNDMECGDDWWRQIQKAIENVDTMILVLSPRALESDVVAQEWHYARQKGTRVIPVQAEDVDFNSVLRWMKRLDWLDLRPDAPERDLTWQRLIAQLRTPYEPRRVPFPETEKLPSDFVPRHGVFEPIVRALVHERHGAVGISAALRGAGGYGKTTIARAIIHDVRVRGAFDDGILWITLGEQPESLLGKLQDVYVRLTDKPCPYQTMEGTKEALAELLKDRYVLIVIDDVWNVDHLKPFLFGGAHCAHLITTRYDETLPTEVAFKQAVDAMQPDEAIALMASGLPEQAAAQHETALKALAARLFHWALLLKLANGFLRDYDAATERGLRDLNELLDAAGIVGLDDQRLVEKMLEATFSRLKPEEVDRFRDLRVFPEDVRVPLDAIQRLWSKTGNLQPIFCKRLLDRFEKLSLLLEYDRERGAVRLHDAIRAAALAYRPTDLTELHSKFLRAYGVENWADLPRDEPYLWDHLAYHLLAADRRAELRAALLDCRYLQAKLDARDANALLSDFDAFLKGGDDKPVRLVRQAVEMSAHVLTEDKAALAHQLYGRLYVHKELAEIAALRRQIAALGTLIPLNEPVYELQAGGHLLRTLRGHEGSVSGALELRDGRLLSWDYETLRLWAADGTELKVLRGHEKTVRGALELRDGRLLSWSRDKTLRLWAADGTELAVLREHEDQVRGALELRDGRLLSWSRDKTLRLWAANGAEIAVLRGHEWGVYGALELQDGRLLSWAYDNMLRLWAADGTELAVLRGHEWDVNGALELRDGRLLSWAWDKTLRLWAADGTEIAVLRGHEFWISGARELRDGRLLSWSGDKTLRLWAADGTEIAVLRGHEGSVIGALELRDGRLLSWSSDNTLRLWAANGMALTVLRRHEGWVEGALELRDGRLLLWGGWTLGLQAADGTALTILRGHEGAVSGALELRDGRLLSWSEDKTLRLWATDGTETVLRGHRDEVRGALALRDGRLLSWDYNTLRLWAADGTERAVLRGHRDKVLGALELRDGRLLSWSLDQTLRLWAADGTEIAVLRGHEWGVYGALELRDGGLLSWDYNTLRLWAADGAALNFLRGHEDQVRGALELQDERLLSWADGFYGDNTLRLWAADGTEIAVLRGHRDKVRGARELRDGRLLSWAADKTLRLWAADGTALTVLRRHWGEVLGARELQDGRLLSWAEDKTLRLWAADGTDLAVLRGHEGSIEGALELRDGRLLSWSEDNTLRLWAADGTPLGAMRRDASPSELRAWFAAHDADWGTFIENWRHYAIAPEQDLLAWHGGAALHLCRAETGEELERFYAESAISVARFLQGGAVVALGCENGQVIFLKVAI